MVISRKIIIIGLIVALAAAGIAYLYESRNNSMYRDSISARIELVNNSLSHAVVDGPEDVAIAYSRIESLRLYHSLARFEKNVNSDQYYFVEVAYIALSNKMLNLTKVQFDDEVVGEVEAIMDSALRVSKWYSGQYDVALDELIDQAKLADSVQFIDGHWQLK